MMALLRAPRLSHIALSAGAVQSTAVQLDSLPEREEDAAPLRGIGSRQLATFPVLSCETVLSLLCEKSPT